MVGSEVFELLVWTCIILFVLMGLAAIASNWED